MRRERPWAEYMTRIMKGMNGKKCKNIKILQTTTESRTRRVVTNPMIDMTIRIRCNLCRHASMKHGSGKHYDS